MRGNRDEYSDVKGCDMWEIMKALEYGNGTLINGNGNNYNGIIIIMVINYNGTYQL